MNSLALRVMVKNDQLTGGRSKQKNRIPESIKKTKLKIHQCINSVHVKLNVNDNCKNSNSIPFSLVRYFHHHTNFNERVELIEFKTAFLIILSDIISKQASY